MNTIATFRKCTLTDDELLKKVDEQTDYLFEYQMIPTRHIPARPNDDYDLLVGELILRFRDKLNSDKNAQVSDTTESDSSTIAE